MNIVPWIFRVEIAFNNSSLSKSRCVLGTPTCDFRTGCLTVLPVASSA